MYISISFVMNVGNETIDLVARGVHSLLYFAYTCVRDLFIGGDNKRKNRQLWVATQQLASTKVHTCLGFRVTTHQKNMTKGTQFYLHIISSYIDVILSTHLSLFGRCKVASKISFFLHLWKLWLHLGIHTYVFENKFN